MFITKSLFVDFIEFPKLAWWKVNDLQTYKKINDLEDEEKEQDIIELGQKIEDIVGDYLTRKFGYARFDVFEDNPMQDLDEDDEDILVIDPKFKSKIERNIYKTLEAIKNKEELIYQAGFQYNNLFVRVDYLKLNEDGNYDIIEIKAKTGVRKDKEFEKCKNKNIGELYTKFQSDISFQKYVINKTLEANNIEYRVGKAYFSYLNHKYKLNGDLNLNKLVILDEITNKDKVIILESEENSKEEIIHDLLMSEGKIEEKIKEMEEVLYIPENKFNKKYQFSGSKFIEYFGKERPFGTIYGRGVNSKNAVKSLHVEGKIKLEELSSNDLDLFNTKNGEGTARKFINKYLYCKNKNTNLIDEESIRDELSKYNYPLYFYDYETISIPVPKIQNTGPYQQAVVQYSIHKVYEDGNIEHYSGIYGGEGENRIEEIEVEKNKNIVELENEKIIYGEHKFFLETFINDIGEDIRIGSFIVWNKGFENSRNNEIGKTYPDLEYPFALINENTFDLMDIFKKGFYFDLNFKGSNSIKYVLPVLVPEMTYEGMEVPNGAVAMKLLDNIISGEIKDKKEKEDLIKNLLLYCGQDSLAMYKIFERIKSS